MGQGPSQETVSLETRIEDPKNTPPRGLALIAHGRLGGTFDQPPVRLLAEYLRDTQQLRVVTWNARGMGQSGGGNEWSNFGVWLGDAGVFDYKRMLKETVTKYVEDFPATENARLFICGYSAGAVFAGCTRPPPGFPQFAPARYILITYPVDLLVLIGLWKSGSYFRSVGALVQGQGWENLPAEFRGAEPDVTGVLTITGGQEQYLGYGLWTRFLGSKNARNVLRQVVVDGAGHDWSGKAPCIVEEVDRWLADGS